MGPVIFLLLAAAPEASPYAELLSAHVEDGVVDYAGLSKRSAELKQVVAAIGAATLPKAREDQIGFLVDAYNLLVLSEVVRLGQPKSVLDVKDFFSAPRHRVAGETMSLDQLEKQRILPLAKDPRLHFALVCGARGCPILEREPWTRGRLEDRLQRATRRYLASPHGLRVGPSGLHLSKIFEWYGQDFGGEAGVRALIHSDGPKAAQAVAKDAKITYLEYDWRLNGP